MYATELKSITTITLATAINLMNCHEHPIKFLNNIILYTKHKQIIEY